MRNEDALSPGGMIFGIAVLLITVTFIVLIVANAQNQPSIQDTYGTTLATADPNSTYNLTSSIASTGIAVGAPVILVGAVVFVAFVAFLVYAYVKNN